MTTKMRIFCHVIYGLLAVIPLTSAHATDVAISDETDNALSCHGPTKGGGMLICQGRPGSTLSKDGQVFAKLDKEGWAYIGLDREPVEIIIIAAKHGEHVERLSLATSQRDDPIRILDGMDCDKIDARTPAQKDHARQSWVIKQKAFNRFEPAISPRPIQFIRPAAGRMSSPFGPVRKYHGVSKVTGKPCTKTSIHRGYDIAAPIGTPIIAPAPGIVTLAEADLYYEGGTVFLDHGKGLVSVFMHMSAIDVMAGQQVKIGESLGMVGNTGRTTGPHLHWAVKWRNPESTDRSTDFYIDPALLLEYHAAPDKAH